MWYQISPLIGVSVFRGVLNRFTENRSPALDMGGTAQKTCSLDVIIRKGGLADRCLLSAAFHVSFCGLFLLVMPPQPSYSALEPASCGLQPLHCELT